MFFIKKQNSNSQGMTLVAALLILSLSASTVMLVTSIIAMQVRMSLNSINSISSYYAAESGIERSLYYLKFSQDYSDFVNNFDKLETNSEWFNFVRLNNFEYYDGEYTIQVASTTVVKNWSIYNLSTSSPQHLDIIEPSGMVSTIYGPASPTYYLHWSIDNCFPEAASSRLETTIYSFEQNFTNPQTSSVIDICNCEYGSNDCDVVTRSTLDSSRYYRFSFRPLDHQLTKLNFRVDSGIKSQAYVKVEGRYRGSNYLVSAQLPALSPASDIFSYVIFSEEDLTKGF